MFEECPFLDPVDFLTYFFLGFNFQISTMWWFFESWNFQALDWIGWLRIRQYKDARNNHWPLNSQLFGVDCYTNFIFWVGWGLYLQNLCLRLGHACKHSGTSPHLYAKLPSMFSLNSLAYWLQASTTHTASVTWCISDLFRDIDVFG